MNPRIQIFLVALLATLTYCCQAKGQQEIDLSILYAGEGDSERMEDFRSFLNEHFTHVTTVDLKHFRERVATDHDVVIFDWPRFDPQAFVQITKDSDRPTVLMGAVAGMTGNRLGIKINHLCQCLYGDAHGLRTDHEMFHRPYAVDVTFRDQPTPKNYRDFPGSDDPGPTMKMWKVQQTTKPPGVVSDPFGFEDSPDAEVISSGVNQKGPESVALARHADFFQWGFSASPQKCFANAVCYTSKFDGQRSLVRRQPVMHRRWAFVVAEQSNFANCFAEELLEEADYNRRRLIDLVSEKLEYLYYHSDDSDDHFGVDPDAAHLGLSNRRVESLERCIESLANESKRAAASRMLKRYTGENFDDAQQWQLWLDRNREKLFFSDIAGYRFILAPAASPNRAKVSAPRSKAEQPVAATLRLRDVEDDASRKRLEVRVSIAPGWYIYAINKPVGNARPTSLRLQLPDGVDGVGGWKVPAAKKHQYAIEEAYIYGGDLVPTHLLQLDSTEVAGELECPMEKLIGLGLNVRREKCGLATF